MLSKYASPDNDDFKAVSGHLLDIATEARKRIQEKSKLYIYF